MPEPLEFYVPGERVRWVERQSRAPFVERFGTVRHDAGKHVVVKPDDASVLDFDGYAPMRDGDTLRMPRVHLTHAAHQGPGLE